MASPIRRAAMMAAAAVSSAVPARTQIVFGNPASSTTGTGTRYVASADLNADGKPDLASANSSGNSVSIFINNGDGTFPATGAASTVGVSSLQLPSPQWAAIADVTGDGKPDIITANYGSATISVIINLGLGQMSPIGIDSATSPKPNALAIADPRADYNGDGQPDGLDFNGDGMADIVAVSQATGGSTGTATVLLNQGGGRFAMLPTLPTGTQPASVSVSDYNKDGFLDFATANLDNTITVYLGAGNGTFSRVTPELQAPGGPVSIVTRDFNADGKPDLAVARQAYGGVSIFLGKGNGKFNTGQSYAAFACTSPYPNALDAGDFNADHKLDLIVTNPGQWTLTSC